MRHYPLFRRVEKSGRPARKSGAGSFNQPLSTIGNQALQQSANGKKITPAEKHRIAQSGFKHSHSALPYLDSIQRSFGKHSIANVNAHLDNSAAASNNALNSAAYNMGNDIAFSRTPDLFTTAHEAAHVVQQRSGLTLNAGIGARGDRHEQHADQVAHAVVQGKSSESLLNEYKYSADSNSVAGQLQFQERDPRADTFQARPPNFQPRAIPQPEGAGVAAQGECELPTGILRWELAPRVGYVNERVEFFPNASVAATDPTISYIQTVSSSYFNPDGSSEVDTLNGETDPYYGAQWDEDNQTWADEPRSVQRRDPAYDNMSSEREGSRPYTAQTGSAVLNDSPHLNIKEIKYFETVIVVIETGEVLGSLSWNIQRWEAGFAPSWMNRMFGWQQPTSTIVRNVICSPGSSPEFNEVVRRYYELHPDSVRSEDGLAP